MKFNRSCDQTGTVKTKPLILPLTGRRHGQIAFRLRKACRSLWAGLRQMGRSYLAASVEELLRILRNALDQHLEMQMRPS